MCILFGQAVVNYKCDGRVNIYCDKYGEGIRQIFFTQVRYLSKLAVYIQIKDVSNRMVETYVMWIITLPPPYERDLVLFEVGEGL